jgi:hypothetical protein
MSEPAKKDSEEEKKDEPEAEPNELEPEDLDKVSGGTIKNAVIVPITG